VAEDRVRLHAIFTLPGVRRYIFDDQVIPPEQTVEIVEKSVVLFRERGLGLWIAERQAGSIGFGGFWFFRDPSELELLYGVVDAEVGHGYGREIARAMVDYGFETLQMPVIRASCDCAHAASRKLLVALGFCLAREDRVAGLDTVFYEIRKRPDPVLPRP
jgi:ribosomal-protein-alanine N-acetyltransferase